MTHDYMTGAELQTMREGCNLSRDELGELVGVAARTVKHWENGRTGVPADVAQHVAALGEIVGDLAQAEAARVFEVWRQAPEQQPAVVVRIRQEADARRMGAPLASCPVSVHGALVRLVCEALRRKIATVGDYGAGPVRVVWFDAADYGAWLAQVGAPDTPESLDHWALQQVAQQARPHRGDQPA